MPFFTTGMRLLIATPLYPPEIGGPATYAHTLEGELPQRGITVTLVKFSTVRKYPKFLRHLLYGWNVYRALAEADMVLALDPVSVGLPTALAARLRRKPLIVKIVGDYAWEQGQQRFGVTDMLDAFVKRAPNELHAVVRMFRSIETFVAREAVRIIVPSAYLKGIVTAWGIDPNKITVIYNAFDGVGSLSPKEDARRMLGLHGTVVVTAGRLVPWKGFMLLIDVIAEIRKEMSITLYIAGSGPDEGKLKQRIIEKGLAQSVVLLGQRSHDELMNYISAADCFVLNTGYEGLSHQLLEVLAVGTPLVTTAVGGNPEIVEHDVTGLLVPYDAREELTAAVRSIITDRARGERMAREGQRFVSTFTVKRMVDEVALFLNSLSS